MSGKKIIRGLKQAVRHAKGEPTGPIVFEHKAPEKSKFDVISDRVIAAIEEVNAAFKEAHECAEMRIFLDVSREMPMQFRYHIYRLMRSVMTYTVTTKEPEWKLIKDPAFQVATGNPHAYARKSKP